ncbi:MAG: hypothetical protein JWQ43_1532 [Glaciihabitans sp.]|nr:hypothetical protein [Glaciihabitans sp.]
MLHRPIMAAAGVLLLALLSGCSTQAETPAPASTAGAETTTEPDSAGGADATSTPSALPTNTGEYTCESILSPGTLAVFEDQEEDGFTLQDDFIERSRNFGGNLVDFADYGGVLCQWAFPSGDGAVDYGYSPITDAQATAEMDALIAGGYVSQVDKRGTLVVNADAGSFTDSYLFTDGAWFYGSDKTVLNLIVDNFPAPQ